GLFFRLRRRTLCVHGGVQVPQSRLQPMSADQSQRDDSHEQTQHEPLDWPSAIEPFRNEMSDRDCPADHLERKISSDYDLGGGASITTRQEPEHFLRKEG